MLPCVVLYMCLEWASVCKVCRKSHFWFLLIITHCLYHHPTSHTWLLPAVRHFLFLLYCRTYRDVSLLLKAICPIFKLTAVQSLLLTTIAELFSIKTKNKSSPNARIRWNCPQLLLWKTIIKQLHVHIHLPHTKTKTSHQFTLKFDRDPLLEGWCCPE